MIRKLTGESDSLSLAFPDHPPTEVVTGAEPAIAFGTTRTASALTEGLNPEQRRAVEHETGPLLVVAGAGTGKTKVVTNRIAHLIVSKRARPDEILALTFTDKAAAEMEERVDLLVPYGFTDVWISTFHSFGDRMLREHALELGLHPGFRVLTRAEQVIFLREHWFDLPLRYYRPLGDPTRHIAAVLSLISRAKDEDVSPEEYEKFAFELRSRAGVNPGDEVLRENAMRESEVAALYAHYQREMGKAGLVDFGDQVMLTLRLLREHPSLLAEARERFRYILVDEFQDTNYAQFALVQLLAGGSRNITVVGDDDQSIYRFRGAALTNILSFKDAYPDATEVVLTRNYRSTQGILDSAYRLIQQNNPERLEIRNGIVKRLRAQAGEGEGVKHLHFDTHEAEADEVALRIDQAISSGEFPRSEIAVLVRSNAAADAYLRSLAAKGIPYRFSGGARLYQRNEVRLCLSFLRAVADPDESRALFHLAGSELHSVPMEDLLRANQAAHTRKRSLGWVLEHRRELAPSIELSKEGEEAVARMLDDLAESRAQVPTRTSGEVLYDFLKRTGTVARLAEGDSLADEERAQNVAKFFAIVRNAGRVLRNDSVPDLVRYLDLLIEAGDDPAAAEVESDVDAVSVLTVHKAKGLEFGLVFLVGCVSDQFPVRSRKEPIPFPDGLLAERAMALPSGDYHRQEERRLFYVGMTRARQRLVLTSAEDYGGKRAKKVSPFVLEALDAPAIAGKPVRGSSREAIGRFAPVPEAPPGSPPPISDDVVLTLSHKQIDDYDTCPAKYRYIHVLRVPILRHHSIVYGAAVHAAVEEFHKARQKGKVLTEEELLAVFEAHWASEGFVHRQHEELRLAQGKRTLRAFREREIAKGTVPTFVEREFSVVLGNNRIVGRWDRVDVSPDGSAVITDYKTSDVDDPEKAREKAEDNLQLSIYALAYGRMAGRLPERVELSYVESGVVGSSTRTEEDVIETETKIADAAERIRRHEFAAQPAYLACRSCAYSDICPATAYRE